MRCFYYISHLELTVPNKGTRGVFLLTAPSVCVYLYKIRPDCVPRPTLSSSRFTLRAIAVVVAAIGYNQLSENMSIKSAKVPSNGPPQSASPRNGITSTSTVAAVDVVITGFVQSTLSVHVILYFLTAIGYFNAILPQEHTRTDASLMFGVEVGWHFKKLIA